MQSDSTTYTLEVRESDGYGFVPVLTNAPLADCQAEAQHYGEGYSVRIIPTTGQPGGDYTRCGDDVQPRAVYANGFGVESGDICALPRGSASDDATRVYVGGESVSSIPAPSSYAYNLGEVAMFTPDWTAGAITRRGIHRERGAMYQIDTLPGRWLREADLMLAFDIEAPEDDQFRRFAGCS